MALIYLDNAATTPILKEVYDAMQPFLLDKYGNPSSIYSLGRESKIAIEKVRQLISEELGCQRGEIIFTSSGTESINKSIYASIFDLGCKRIITSSIEHHATLHTIEFFQKKFNIDVQYIKINEDGHIDYHHLEQILKKDTSKCLVSLLHANNEIGNITDIHLVSKLCKENNALLHLDTVQTIAHYKINLKEVEIDFLSSSAHKFHGPKGVGFLYFNQKNKIEPIFFGGGQERNMRAGTENVAGIVGLGKAFELAYLNLEKNTAYILSLKNYLKEKLQKEFENLIFYGAQNHQQSLYTVLNVGFLKTNKTDMLTFQLDMAEICVSSGSACSSGSEKMSHVISALGASSNHYQPIRFSFNHFNTKKELDLVCHILKDLILT